MCASRISLHDLPCAVCGKPTEGRTDVPEFPTCPDCLERRSEHFAVLEAIEEWIDAEDADRAEFARRMMAA